MTVTIPSEKVIGMLVRDREQAVAASPSRRSPWPKLDISEKRLDQVRAGMADVAVTATLADMLLGRIDAVDSVSDLLRLAELRLQRRVDEL